MRGADDDRRAGHGKRSGIGFAASQGNFELNVFLPVLAHEFLQSARLLAEGMRSFRLRCADGIRANREKMAENLRRSLMLVTALSPTIGYEAAAETAKLAHREDLTLREACLRLGYLTGEQFDALFHPEDGLKAIMPCHAESMAGALCVSVQMVVDAEHDRRSLGARGRALRKKRLFSAPRIRPRAVMRATLSRAQTEMDAVSAKPQLSGVERLAALLHKAVENDAHLLARDERLGAIGAILIAADQIFPQGPAHRCRVPLAALHVGKARCAVREALADGTRQHRNEHGAVQASIRFIRKVSHAFKKIQRDCPVNAFEIPGICGHVAKEMAGLAQIERVRLATSSFANTR